MSDKSRLRPSDVDRWLDDPMTKVYLDHLSRHAEFYKKQLLSGLTIEKTESALVLTARTIGAIEALETKQKLIFFDMKREIENYDKRVLPEE